MSAMLLSIKPKYAKVILEGKKQYEFRKSRPKDGVDRIIFYASAPLLRALQRNFIFPTILEKIRLLHIN